MLAVTCMQGYQALYGEMSRTRALLSIQHLTPLRACYTVLVSFTGNEVLLLLLTSTSRARVATIIATTAVALTAQSHPLPQERSFLPPTQAYGGTIALT
jgi:hypothetical protein